MCGACFFTFMLPSESKAIFEIPFYYKSMRTGREKVIRSNVSIKNSIFQR